MSASPRATVAEVRSSFAKLVRDEVKLAAGTDKVVQPAERAALSPVPARAADGLGSGDRGVNDVVDAAMARTVAAWNAVNQQSGPGKKWLSKAEVARLDPDLAILTGTAVAIALKKKTPPLPLDVHLDGAPAGVTLSSSGSLYTVTAASTVPVDSAFSLVIDGAALPLSRGPAGITADTLRAPAGYGLEVRARTPMTAADQSTTLEITRDAPAWLPPDALLAKATAGLVNYLKNDRIDDPDWGQYFPTTWPALESAGLPAQIDAFFRDPATDVVRGKDSVLYIGRGPYALSTEIDVRKRDGKIMHALVEID